MRGRLSDPAFVLVYRAGEPSYIRILGLQKEGYAMKTIIKTDKAPAAIGPYSQAIKIQSGTLLFCSGQIPINPATGEIVGKSSADQCKQVMDNISELLKAAGSDLSKIVKTTIFLTDLRDFAPVNDMYSTYFTSAPPARSTVEVSRLPKEVKIEIEVVAYI
jgi:2-iminobutanoate/2-iminopropanoate deaminase